MTITNMISNIIPNTERTQSVVVAILPETILSIALLDPNQMEPFPQPGKSR